jgi:hypothetical protein
MRLQHLVGIESNCVKITDGSDLTKCRRCYTPGEAAIELSGLRGEIYNEASVDFAERFTDSPWLLAVAQSLRGF